MRGRWSRCPLVQLLRTGDAEGKKIMAAWALSNLSLNSENKVAIARAGAVAEPLVQLLRTGDEAGKAQAASALSILAANSDN